MVAPRIKPVSLIDTSPFINDNVDKSDERVLRNYNSYHANMVKYGQRKTSPRQPADSGTGGTDQYRQPAPRRPATEQDRNGAATHRARILDAANTGST